MSLETAGFPVQQVETLNGGKVIKDPMKTDTTPMFGIAFQEDKTGQDAPCRGGGIPA